MSEIKLIKYALEALQGRVEREEEKQHHHSHCSACGSEEDLHRLQQNLAEIRKEMRIKGASQAATMARLKEIINISEARLQRLNIITEALDKVTYL